MEVDVLLDAMAEAPADHAGDALWGSKEVKGVVGANVFGQPI